MPSPTGKVMHAELQLGDSRLFLADEFPEMGARAPGPRRLAGDDPPVRDDADATFAGPSRPARR